MPEPCSSKILHSFKSILFFSINQFSLALHPEYFRPRTSLTDLPLLSKCNIFFSKDFYRYATFWNKSSSVNLLHNCDLNHYNGIFNKKVDRKFLKSSETFLTLRNLFTFQLPFELVRPRCKITGYSTQHVYSIFPYYGLSSLSIIILHPLKTVLIVRKLC